MDKKYAIYDEKNKQLYGESFSKEEEAYERLLDLIRTCVLEPEYTPIVGLDYLTKCTVKPINLIDALKAEIAELKKCCEITNRSSK